MRIRFQVETLIPRIKFVGVQFSDSGHLENRSYFEMRSTAAVDI